MLSTSFSLKIFSSLGAKIYFYVHMYSSFFEFWVQCLTCFKYIFVSPCDSFLSTPNLEEESFKGLKIVPWMTLMVAWWAFLLSYLAHSYISKFKFEEEVNLLESILWFKFQHVGAMFNSHESIIIGHILSNGLRTILGCFPSTSFTTCHLAHPFSSLYWGNSVGIKGWLLPSCIHPSVNSLIS